jgi:3-deoxy-D-manno-octulosonic-acid transferase
MLTHNGVSIVNSEQELYEKIKSLLVNAEKYQEMSKNCLSIFESNRGALDFAISKTKEYV